MPNTWKLTNLYKTNTDPQIQKDIEEGTLQIQTFVKKWKNNKEYTKNPHVLKIALDEYEELSADGKFNKPYLYYALKNYLNQSDAEVKSQLNKLEEKYTNIVNDIQFFDLNIAKIPKSKRKDFLDYPELLPYKHNLEKIFKASKYNLSNKEEKVFNITAKTSFSNWADMISELLNKQTLNVLDEDLKKVSISYNETSKYLNSQNKKVRDYAGKEFNKINERYLEIAEFEINSELEASKKEEEYRKITRPDFPRHLGDDIETEVVDTLIKTVTDNFSISREYYSKKVQLLGLKQIGYYEKNVPIPSIETDYSFEKSMKIVKATFEKLDPLFAKILTTFQENGEYDVYPKKGKRGGAFCLSMDKKLPTYILLNHTNKLNDVLTIAHETGHGIHHVLSTKQNALNSDNPTSLAETASTFFENFVLENILKTTTDKKERLALLDKGLMDEMATIFRQVAFYNFETELHHDYNEKGFLTKEYISDLFCKHMKAYLGESVKEDENMRNGWIYVSHFRRPFYVYSYASGLLISKALQAIVKEDKKNIKYVKTFLESGSSKSPKDLFMSMGIDITKEEFWQKGINSIKENLDKL